MAAVSKLIRAGDKILQDAGFDIDGNRIRRHKRRQKKKRSKDEKIKIRRAAGGYHSSGVGILNRLFISSKKGSALA